MTRQRTPVAAALLLLLATVLLGLVPASPAQATHKRAKPCPVASTADHAKSAGSVFIGRVTAVTAKGNGAKDPDKLVVTFTHTVTLERIYKGSSDLFTGDTGTVDTVKVVTTKTSGACSLGRLQVGQDYVFFTRNQGGVVAAATGSGTAPAAPTLVTTIQNLLGPGQDPTPPPPATATFTRVADSSPPTLTRLLAPGVALLLIGLLGLAVVGRLGRR